MSAKIAVLVPALMIALTCGPVPWAAAVPGVQYVRTESGAVRCVVMPTQVICEHGPGFPQAPVSQYGSHFDNAEVTPAGNFQWNDGNIGGGGTPQNDLVLNYGQTYHTQGWTIVPNEDGTRFTNDSTGHGMFVSIENVSSF
jgi:hypothetical protein